MAVRLSKIAREFNVGLSTIVDFLHSKGIKISSDPNAKLTEEDYALVAKEFSSDSEVKKESNLVDLKNTRKKKETVSIDDSGNVSTDKEETEENDEFISVKDEVKLENKIKIVDHIDLTPKQQSTPAPVIEEEIPEAIASQPSIKNEIAEVEETAAEEEIIENEPEEIEEEKEVLNEETADNTPFKVAQPVLKDVKVVGTIDLDAINQRTRPPKKSKQERERDRRELKKNSKPALLTKPVTAQETTKPTDGANSSEEDSDIRKKRKRIHRQDEKIQLEPTVTTPVAGGKNSKIEENKRKLKKLKKKKNEKAEISDEDVDKQIKDTFARLGSKGKSQTSKHRRDKRDAVQQKLQAELEQEEKEKSILKLTEFVTVAELATMMNISVTEVISACMSLGLFVSINQRLDAETINIVADEIGYSVELVSKENQDAIDEEEDDSEDSRRSRRYYTASWCLQRKTGRRPYNYFPRYPGP